jgi:anionic cell wall polymer biosynthesis LytR-Cps2A-Psr (LCP) family protein
MEGKMRKYVIIIAIVAGILCIILMIGLYAALDFYFKPQAPTMSLITSTSTKVKPTSITELNPTATKPVVPTETEPVNPTQAPELCGQSGSWTLLFLGRTVHKNPAPAQTIRLVKVDFDQKTTLIYSFPPELILETPGLVKEYKIQTARLQDIFTAIVIADGESRETSFKATQATAQALLDNFGIVSDHYMTVKEDFVMEATDQVGGIDVVVPQDLVVPPYFYYPNGLTIKAGNQNFDGKELHAYTTWSTGPADEFSRLARQNVVLAGLWKKMLDPAVYLQLPKLYSIYKDHIITDLSPEQITVLACAIRLVPSENIKMETPSMDQYIVNQDGSMKLAYPQNYINQVQTLFGVP